MSRTKIVFLRYVVIRDIFIKGEILLQGNQVSMCPTAPSKGKKGDVNIEGGPGREPLLRILVFVAETKSHGV